MIRVFLQHLNGLYQQIIEIHHVRESLPFLVFLLEKLDLIRERVGTSCIFRQSLAPRDGPC